MIIGCLWKNDVNTVNANEHANNWRKKAQRQYCLQSYALNLQLVLLTHLIGVGNEAGTQILGLLDLSVHSFCSRWSFLEQIIGTAKKSISKKI